LDSINGAAVNSQESFTVSHGGHSDGGSLLAEALYEFNFISAHPVSLNLLKILQFPKSTYL
jgi:hypothetical protein